MANSVGKYLLQVPKAIADVVTARAIGAITKRVNEFTTVFQGADGSTTKLLRADLTWSGLTTENYSTGAHAMLPADDTDWARPAGAGTDYYRTLNAAVRIAIPFPQLRVGDVITEVGVVFYRHSSNNPTSTLYVESTTGSAATAQTPTVAWTTPGSTDVWGTLVASYDVTVSQGACHLSVLANNTGDRVRSAYVIVERAIVTDG